VAKMRRPDAEESVVDRRLARREHDIRDRVAEHERQLVELGMLFGNYRDHPRPDAIQGQLSTITDLELMALPEHRSGIAGALIGTLGLHPERAHHWKGHSPKLYAAAERLIPPDGVEAVLTGDHIEFLWMLWLTAGDLRVLRRIFKEAHKGGHAGDRATAILIVHAHLPDVAHELLRSIATGQTVGQAPVPLPAAHQGVRTDVPQADVSALTRHITTLPGGIQRVILVGWTPARDGTFLVITPNGQTWPDCPQEWAGRPVVVIKADAQQLAIHQQVQARMLDP